MTAERPQPTEIAIPKGIPWIKGSPIKDIPKDEENWISEPMWNGRRVRIFVSRSKDKPIIISEKEGVITHLFPDIWSKFKHLSKYHAAFIEGDIFYGYGRSDEERKTVEDRDKTLILDDPVLLTEFAKCNFVATEMLFLDNRDCTQLTTVERKVLLDRIITPYMMATFDLDANAWFTEPHDAAVEIAKKQNYLGIIFKEKKARYDKRAKWKRLQFHQF